MSDMDIMPMRSRWPDNYDYFREALLAEKIKEHGISYGVTPPASAKASMREMLQMLSDRLQAAFDAEVEKTASKKLGFSKGGALHDPSRPISSGERP